MAEYVAAKHYGSDERVYMKCKPNSYDFTYIYEFLFKQFDILFPLSTLEAKMLTTMDVAPSQLYPNN